MYVYRFSEVGSHYGATRFNPLNVKIDQLTTNFSSQYQYIIKRTGYENELNDHNKEINVIFQQILPANTVRKCIVISQENLFLNSRAQRVKHVLHMNTFHSTLNQPLYSYFLTLQPQFIATEQGN